MAKGPWKKKPERKRPAIDVDLGGTPNGHTAVIEPPTDTAGQIPGIGSAPKAPVTPPPLPPLALEKNSSGKGGTIFDEAQIKDGLGKAFCSITKGGARLINYTLRNGPYRVEFVDVEPAEGELWAQFAYPVLKMQMPNLEQHPVTVLCVMTALILSGKIKVTKLEAAKNANRIEEGNNTASDVAAGG